MPGVRVVVTVYKWKAVLQTATIEAGLKLPGAWGRRGVFVRLLVFLCE